MNLQFTELAQRTNSNVDKIKQNVLQIDKMVNQIGTLQDSDSLRSSMHKLIQSTNSLAKDTNILLMDLSRCPTPFNEFDQRQQKQEKEKIMDDFTKALNNLQSTQRKTATKEKASIERAKVNSGFNINDVPFKEELTFSNKQKQTHLQMEEDINISELREREDAIKKIETDITDVNQIFKDLAMLVHEQGDMIDSIEANVEGANVQVEQANVQLNKARRYQIAARRKMCIIFAILASIITILALIIWGVSK